MSSIDTSKTEVWGPPFWFFIHTLALSYPNYPNEITKRKYYDTITNMPLFIPNEKMGDAFARLLDEFPVTPYLTNKDSLMHWTFFIHNKYNKVLGKREITFDEAIQMYADKYHPKAPIKKHLNLNTTHLYYGLIILLLIAVLFLTPT